VFVGRAIAILIIAGAPRVFATPLACPQGAILHETRTSATIQDACERPDGTKHGPYRSFWAPGGTQRQTEGQYVDGKQDGLWSMWHVDGKRWEETHYQRGLKHGLWTVRNAKGSLEVRGEYRAGKEHGTWTWWHPNGNKKATGAYVDGSEQGRWIEWDESGDVTSAGDFNAGLHVGKWTVDDGHFKAEGAYCGDQRCGRWQVFVDGHRDSVGNFVRGLPSGEWTYWIEGKLRARGLFVGGAKTGRWSYWDLETGQRVATIECRKGQPHGRRTEWWPNGKLAMTGSYVDGHLHGEWLQVDEAGIRSRSVYDRGSLRNGDSVEPDDGLGISSDGERGRALCAPEAFMGSLPSE
jgi:antitoxin component YwqK of YwqJK toxin-antitoxin module